MATPTPTFNFCSRYTGKEMSAFRWLKSFEHELAVCRDAQGQIPPATYLYYLDLLLHGEAAEWVESNPEAVRLMATPNPTQDTVSQFSSLMQERFPTKSVEPTPVSFDMELSELRQRHDESLISYYTRTLNLMQKYGAKDRSSTVILTLAESSLLDTFLRVWIKGLNDQSVKRKAAEGMGNPSRSLRAVYGLAEQAKLVNMEIQRLFNEEVRADELSFYKDLAEKNFSSQQISSMLASHHATKAGRPLSAPQQWSVHEDPYSQASHQYSSQRQETYQTPRRSESSARPTPPPPLAQNQNYFFS